MEAPEKIYVQLPSRNWIGRTWNETPIKDGDNPNWKNATNIEYTRTDAFIEKAAEFLYNYNQKQVLKHGARATLGCGEYTINVDEFRKYMEDSL